MNGSTNAIGSEFSLIKGGLLNTTLDKVGLTQIGYRKRIAVFILLTFLPTSILALHQGVGIDGQVKIPFLLDFAELSRFLIVGPLLILAEAFVEPWLVKVIQHIKIELIDEKELPAYDKVVSWTIRWRDSYAAEALLFLYTFVWQWFDAHAAHVSVTTWQHLPSGETTFAWYWYAYIAKPLFRFLWLRWLWRYILWSIALSRLAMIKLKTQATHPDRHGGLSFIAEGHAKFSIIAFACGIQAASILADQIVFEGRTLMSFRYDILGFVIIVLTVSLFPLLAFTSRLLEAKRLGIFEFGSLAGEYSRDFRQKWISQSRTDEPLLGSSDIQSLADMGNSYQVVHEMRTCLIGKENVIRLTIVTLLPFSPLLLTVYPFDELLNHLLKALL